MLNFPSPVVVEWANKFYPKHCQRVHFALKFLRPSSASHSYFSVQVDNNVQWSSNVLDGTNFYFFQHFYTSKSLMWIS